LHIWSKCSYMSNWIPIIIRLMCTMLNKFHSFLLINLYFLRILFIRKYMFILYKCNFFM